ncbi:MAG TPA: hypothetical protein VHO43_08805 [Ignavibacteriales bacterium]|nr:hypothetical protein [Ignavibacteriales bacterium]
MKSVRLIVIILLALGSEAELSAQDALFTVIASSGKIFLCGKDTSRWTELSAGSRIFKGDRIKTGDNSYLGLCHMNGRTLEILKGGIYNADELSERLAAENTSVTKKLTDFLVGEIIVKNKSKNMKYISAVARENLTFIDKDFPAFTVVMDSSVTFRWYPAKDVPSYAFRLMNPSGGTVLIKETTDTLITLNLEELNLEPGRSYSWLVFNPENPAISSDSSRIMILSRSELESIRDSLQELESDLSDTLSPLNQIMIATFFENNRMNLKALEYYEKSISYTGQVPEFRKKYLLFLIRAGLFKRAQTLSEKWNIDN